MFKCTWPRLGATCGFGGRGQTQYRRRGRDWGRGQTTGGKALKRGRTGPARFSKQPASGAVWKAGAGARVGGARGTKAYPALASTGGIGNPTVSTSGRVLFSHMVLSVFRALGSWYVAPGGHCVRSRCCRCESTQGARQPIAAHNGNPHSLARHRSQAPGHHRNKE